MKAVNLIPRDSRRSGVSSSVRRLGLAHGVLGLLVIVLAYVTLYVLASNTISQRRAQLVGLRQQVSQVQAAVTRLNSYAQFEKLAQARAETVRQIVATRFDWHGALEDLSRVVPAKTYLESLTATTSSGSGSGVSSGPLRGDINAPAFELKGCTGTQDDVARLMSRLRLINGVQRVSFQDSSESGAAAAPSSSTGAGSVPCPAHGPTFDLVVFFQSLPAVTGGGQAGSTSTTGAAK